MGWYSWLLLGVAGLGAGAVNAVGGGGSMISFPALLATGLPPIPANVTNAVAAAPGYLGGSLGYLPELTGQRRRIVLLSLVSIAGALMGSLLLLQVSSDVFRSLVPWLIAGSAVLLAIQPVLKSRIRTRSPHTAALVVSQTIISIYGGFFGAGLGIMMLAALGMFIDDSLHRLNALKGLLSLVVGCVSALFFTLLAPVAWPEALALAVTGFVGGRLGVLIARRIPARAIRWGVVCYGLILAIVLGVHW